MADENRQSMSSAFDDMLKQTRRELEGLYSGSHMPEATGVRLPLPTQAPSRPASGAARRASGGSDAERFLNDRYGDGWTQEILEQKRDGDEVVVLCKLVIEAHDISKTQFGRARVTGGGSAKMIGSAGGVSFSLGGQIDDGRVSSSDAEAAAYREAARDALAKCAAML